MDWMNNLFVVLILTTITGTIFYVMGIPFRKIWFKNSIRLLRFQLRVTQGHSWCLCVCRAVCAYTRISTRVQECYQPVLLYACNSVDEHPADMRMDRILPKTAGRQGEPPIPVDADMPGEHTGRGYGDTGIVYGDL